MDIKFWFMVLVTIISGLALPGLLQTLWKEIKRGFKNGKNN